MSPLQESFSHQGKNEEGVIAGRHQTKTSSSLGDLRKILTSYPHYKISGHETYNDRREHTENDERNMKTPSLIGIARGIHI